MLLLEFGQCGSFTLLCLKFVTSDGFGLEKHFVRGLIDFFSCKIIQGLLYV